ncbi:MAG: DUF1587 domain-containing protein [Blastocatellia bacterium]
MNVEDLKTLETLNSKHTVWDHILQKIQTGEMPPKGAPRPDPEEVQKVVAFLTAEFARLEKPAKPDPGRVTARRLNRAEYNNTVRNLLGVDIRPAEAFPQDDSGYGFDNIGDVLSLSPVLMEKYLTAAENVARTALYGVPAMKPSVTEIRPQGRKIEPSFTPLSEYDVTGLSLPNALHATHRFPVDGEYTFRLFLNGQRPPASEGIKFAVWIDGKQADARVLDPEGGAAFDANRQVFDSFTLDFRLKVTAGEHWVAASPLNLYEGLQPSLNGPNPSHKPAPVVPEFKPLPDRTPEVNERIRKNFEAKLKEKVPVNTVRVNRVDIGGPYNQTVGASPESKEENLCLRSSRRQTSGGLCQQISHHSRPSRLSSPSDDCGSAPLLKLVTMAEQKGDSFRKAFALPSHSRFTAFPLPHRTGSPSGNQQRDSILPHHAARTGHTAFYFLWSSMPDDELLRAADQGTLNKTGSPESPIQRIIKTKKPKLSSKTSPGNGWNCKLESTKPDRERFPEYDDYLRDVYSPRN